MTKFYAFAASLIAVSTHTSAVKVTEVAEFLASAGVDLGAVASSELVQGNDTESGFTNFVHIHECDNCLIGDSNRTGPNHMPEPEPDYPEFAH